jgi:hypothetical protein
MSEGRPSSTWKALIRTAALVALLAPVPRAFSATIPTNFAEYGTAVNGYQDQFTGTALDVGWTVYGGITTSVSGGYLHVSGATTDPSKIMYTGASYDGVTQNVLAMIKVTSTSGTNDSRVGVSTSNTTAGQGMNLMFRGAPSFSNVAFLNDFIAHGPQNTFTWQQDVLYWMRTLHAPNKTGGTDPAFNGVNDCFGKVWPADGTTPEPTNYQFSWASNDSRSGFAGLQTGATYGNATFDVGYVLIQAAGLPSINVGPVVPPTPPEAPINLVANYQSGSGVTLTWEDKSTDETSFQIERSAAAFPFSLLAAKPADATTHLDTLLYPSVTYTYRVRASAPNGNSAWSNEASITTSAAEVPPSAPSPPTNLTATALGSDSVALGWQDNSSDEVGFGLERAEGAAGYAPLFAVKPDVVSFADHSPHPGWPCSYRVRALSVRGASAFSNPASFLVPATLTLTPASGTVTDSTKFTKDAIKLKLSYSFVSGDASAAIDPVTNGMHLQLGATNASVVVSIPEKDETWKAKKKKGKTVSATWKSPKGELPKATVVVDLVKKTVTVTVAGAEFPNVPNANVRTLLACGNAGGAHTGGWTQKKPGVMVFKP